MPLFSRGEAPLRIVLDGQHAMRAILNGVIVWDGTRPALIPVTRMRVTPVTFRAPQVRADANPATVPTLANVAAAMRAPSLVNGSAVVQAPRMQAGVALRAPTLLTDAEIDVLPADISLVMFPAEASQNFDGNVLAPVMAVDAAMLAPEVLTGFAVVAPAMQVSADMGTPIVTVTSTGMVPAVKMSGSVLMPNPVIHAGVNVSAVKATASALMPVPVIFAQKNVNVSAVPMSASVAMPAPTASGSVNPQGMQRGTSALTVPQSTYTKLTPMQAKSGYESTLSSDGLVMPGTVAVALAARITWNLGSATERRLRIVKNGSTVLGEVITSSTHTVQDVTVPGVVLSGGDVLTLEAYASASTTSARTVSADAGVTYLTATPLPVSGGMSKNSTAQNGTVSTWTKVIGWDVRSGYPTTTITSDSLEVAAGAAGTVNVAAQVKYAYEYGTHQCRVKKNGTVVLTSATNNYPSVGSGNTSGAVAVSGSVSVAAGDLLTLEFYTDTGFSGADGITTGVNTYLTYSV